MAGFFQKLAARTLGKGVQFVQPAVPSVFANDGGIGTLAAEPMEPSVTDTPNVRREPVHAAQIPRRVERVADREPVREGIRRRPMSVQEAAEAIFAKGETERSLLPVPKPAPIATVAKESRLAPSGFVPLAMERPVASVRRGSEANTNQAPAIRVTIGRVEVKAEFPAPPTPVAPRPAAPPALTLDDYRRQRDRGLR